MFAGVSGLRSHQTMMDVVGNNIANVNTTGFRASRVQFTDTLSQLLRGASGGSGEATGGINPQQVGLGVQIAKTQLQMGQGGSQLTGQATDVAIQGAGFFGVRLDSQFLFTRAGSFTFDQQGLLTDPQGGVVQGWNLAPGADEINTNDPTGDIRVPVNETVAPQVTTEMQLGGNLSSTTEVGDPPVATAADIFDKIGQSHRVALVFEMTATNEWTMTVEGPDGTAIGTSSLTFDPATGDMLTPTTNPSFSFTPPGGSAFDFDVNFGASGAAASLTQYGGASETQVLEQDGSAAGNLRSFAISDDGVLTGVFSNGKTAKLAQLSLVTFANTAGLISAGNSRFRSTNASGQALIGAAGTSGRGLLASGQLEMSNVELAQEFTNLIIAQRGFQASSRIITTSDEMIQELVNLKR